LWGPDPPTIKSLTLRVGTLKKLARDYDESAGSSASTPCTPIKKRGGLVTPKGSPKRGVQEDSTPVPRAKRRAAAKKVKYEEPETDEDDFEDRKWPEGFMSGFGDDEDDEDDEWRPTKEVHEDVDDEIGEERMKMELVGLGKEEDLEEMVSEEIVEASRALQDGINNPVKDEVIS